jgi:hypothetical protein
LTGHTGFSKATPPELPSCLPYVLTEAETLAIRALR